MATKYEGYVHDTPVAKGIRRNVGQTISRQMTGSRRAAVSTTKAREAEAYQQGILNTLYAWEVQGLPIPGFDKFMASQGQGGPPQPQMPMEPMGGPPGPPPGMPPMGGGPQPQLPITTRLPPGMGPMMPPPGAPQMMG